MKKINRKTLWLVSLMMVLLLITVACNKKGANETEAGKTEEKEAGLPFPYELEDGKISVGSLFQSSIDNPDCDNEYCDNLASLEITNQSEEYCKNIQIVVKTLDGKKLKFEGSDIPAGATAWLFEKSNQTVEVEEKCEEIKSRAKFGEAQLLEDKVSYSVEETNVTVTNLTGEELKDVKVKCHCLFDETYFGGKPYEYTVDSIPAGGSAVVEAADCFLGTAEVVGITE